MSEKILLQMDTQGRVVLPRSIRRSKKSYYSCYAEPDGTVHLIPVVGVLTPKQAYFWTGRWQQGESEASRDLKKGRYKVVSPKKLAAYLASL